MPLSTTAVTSSGSESERESESQSDSEASEGNHTAAEERDRPDSHSTHSTNYGTGTTGDNSAPVTAAGSMTEVPSHMATAPTSTATASVLETQSVSSIVAKCHAAVAALTNVSGDSRDYTPTPVVDALVDCVSTFHNALCTLALVKQVC